MLKYSAKIIAQICEEYLSGKYSHEDICLKYVIHYNETKNSSIIYDWISRYLSNGEQAFINARPTSENGFYSFLNVSACLNLTGTSQVSLMSGSSVVLLKDNDVSITGSNVKVQ